MSGAAPDHAAASGGVPLSRFSGLARRLTRPALALADQAVVSATSFLLLILVARWSDPAEVGLYAIAVSLVVISASAQDALVTRPYAIRAHDPVGSRADDAAATRRLALGWSLLAAAGLLAASLILLARGGGGGLAAALAVLGLGLPLILARELARRLSFADLALGDALVLDAAAATLTIAGVAALGLAGVLSAPTALAATALACAVAAALWRARSGAATKPTAPQLRLVAARNWRVGRWILLTLLAMQVLGYLPYWLSAALLGAEATGVFAACMSVVGLANPVALAVFNVLTPIYARTLHEAGPRPLLRRAALDGLGLCALFSLLVALLHFGGPAIMALLYPRAEYGGQVALLTLLATSFVVATAGGPATVALTCAGRAREAAGLAIAAALLGGLLIATLIPAYGLVGAAWGVLATECAATAARWMVAAATLRRRATEAG